VTRRYFEKLRSQAISAQGIQTSSHYPSVHKFSDYHPFDGESALKSMPVTEEVAAQEVTLRLYPAMSDEDARQVEGAMMNSLGAL
jgi:dTDP-4-amino-4,6-dideoxygalactose transaminase